MVDIFSGRGDSIFRALVIQTNRIGLMGEEIDDRSSKEDKVLLAYSGWREGEIIQLEGEFEGIAFTPPGPFLKTGDIKKEEIIRQVEIFLQKSVAGKRVSRIGDRTAVRGQSHGFEMIGRERKGVLAVRFCKDNPFQVTAKQVITIGCLCIFACQMKPEMSNLPVFEANPLEFKLQDDAKYFPQLKRLQDDGSRLAGLFPIACLFKDKGLHLDIRAGLEQTGGSGNGDGGKLDAGRNVQGLLQ